jgi:hypothetical protein
MRSRPCAPPLRRATSSSGHGLKKWKSWWRWRKSNPRPLELVQSDRQTSREIERCLDRVRERFLL